MNKYPTISYSKELKNRQHKPPETEKFEGIIILVIALVYIFLCGEYLDFLGPLDCTPRFIEATEEDFILRLCGIQDIKVRELT